jgi:hypothetical protein
MVQKLHGSPKVLKIPANKKGIIHINEKEP